MIGTIWKISWLNLKRDRVALALSLVLPLVFFSIFALVFGGMDDPGSSPVAASIVLEDDGALGRAFADALGENPELALTGAADRPAARDLLRGRRASVAVVVPSGFSRAFDPDAGEAARLELLVDASNPLAVQRAVAVLQATALKLGVELQGEATGDESLAGAKPLAIELEDVLGGTGKKPSIAFFAAGIGVMFLLFTVSGRGAILIEERETGVLVRMLASRLRLGELLLGRWLFLAALGFVQVSLMFLWGAIAFGLELFTVRTLLGFVVMTSVTACAAAGFGLVLASACRTRAQLGGVSSVVVLVMSALGGSMFPRFLMPEHLQDLGLLTFNAWALDGYQKIFWYEAPLVDLWPQLAVLGVLAVAFLATARVLAGRWERV